MSDLRLETVPLGTTDTGHCTELLYDDGQRDGVLFCAPHGGEIEPGTAEPALELATRLPDAVCWARLGYDDENPFDVWHPPSTDIAAADHPLLSRIADRGFETVVSIHGLADDELLVGGAAPETRKATVRDAFAETVDVPVRTVSSGPYGGVDPENVVNWLADDGGGIQVEAGPSVRHDSTGPLQTTLASLVRWGALRRTR